MPITAEQILTDHEPLIRLLAGRAAARFGDDPEDWAQDLRLEVFRFAHTFDPARGKVTTWITLRCKRLVGLRKRPPNRRREGRLPTFDPTDAATHDRLDRRARDPADAASTRDLCAKLRGLVAELRDRERAIVTDHYQGETLTEIGARLGIHCAVASQIHRAALRNLAYRLGVSA